MKATIKHLKHTLLPCLAFASAIGVLTGAAIFIFRMASTAVIGLSEHVYTLVRADARYLPLLLLGAAVLGLCAAAILRRFGDCRGGGIPTAVASIRGLVPLKWVQGIFALFFASLATFLGGVPLGNEGPSVLMGASIGKG
ncbi:MAG: chloride channel protein, partial [Clostridia bacterium]|nr:chloride channel protein [Clostridia bacterium]